MGGEGCTIKIDTDLISWFDLDDLIVSKVGVDYEHSLFIMNPSCIQFQEGLKRVNSNESVMKMAKLGVKFRAIAVYILKVGDDVELDNGGRMNEEEEFNEDEGHFIILNS